MLEAPWPEVSLLCPLQPHRRVPLCYEGAQPRPRPLGGAEERNHRIPEAEGRRPAAVLYTEHPDKICEDFLDYDTVLSYMLKVAEYFGHEL